MKTHVRVLVIGGGVVGVSTLYHLTVYVSNNPTSKLAHGFWNPILSVGVVDPVEKGQPFRRIGQQ